jgi:hypothetical protein
VLHWSPNTGDLFFQAWFLLPDHPTFSSVMPIQDLTKLHHPLYTREDIFPAQQTTPKHHGLRQETDSFSQIYRLAGRSFVWVGLTHVCGAFIEMAKTAGVAIVFLGMITSSRISLCGEHRGPAATEKARRHVQVLTNQSRSHDQGQTRGEETRRKAVTL